MVTARPDPSALRLLVVNFAMDAHSPVLAWQQRVARELAHRCAHVVVLTEHVGTYEPAANMTVETVPQHFCKAPLRLLGAKWWLAGRVARWCRDREIDACFLHMNHRWSYRLWPVLGPLGIPMLLWYAHGTVRPSLRLSHRCVDAVVTSSPEGFRIRSRKVATIGQAIDTDVFTLDRQANVRPEIIAVGRIAPRKEVRRIVDAFAALCALRQDVPFRLRLVGPILRGDEGYAQALRDHGAALGLTERIIWTGPLRTSETATLYAEAFLQLNLSRTGSMDKTVLEALASGCPALTSNESFRELLRNHPRLLLTNESVEAIAERMSALYAHPVARPEELRALVVGRHDLAGYVEHVLAATQRLVASRATVETLEEERAGAR